MQGPQDKRLLEHTLCKFLVDRSTYWVQSNFGPLLLLDTLTSNLLSGQLKTRLTNPLVFKTTLEINDLDIHCNLITIAKSL